MADLSITAASVLPGAGAVTENGILSGTVTVGMAIYKDSAGTWAAADSDSATALARAARAIALNGGAAGQPVVAQRSGDITIGATLTPGTTYYLSNTAGGICPLADVGSGEYADIIGIAKSTTVLSLGFNYSGVAL